MNKDVRRYIVFAGICVLMVCGLFSCTLFEQKRSSGVLVEYKGKTLSHADIQRLTQGMSPEDSARIAEQYIYQWAIHLLEYDVAKDKPNQSIEKLVEEYRRALYIHEYEQQLIAQRMPRAIEDTVIQSFYLLNEQYYILRETIVKGLLLIIPNGAPNMDELRKRIQAPHEEENIEWIEKFAYQYATGYELFLDEWKQISQMLLYMPFEQNNLQKQLKRSHQVELQDSTATYLLQVTELYEEGQSMPLDYARPAIEEVILSQRQVSFLQEERKKLFEKAIKDGQIKRYEK